MEKIGVFLPSFLNNLGITEAVKVKFLRKKWKDIFSEPLSEYTYPKEIKEGILYVTVTSHAWLNELRLLKEDFLTKLIPYEIRDVEFKFGKIFPSRQKNIKDEKINKISKQQEQWISNIIEKVEDEEIKILLKNLMEKHLKKMNEKIKGEKYERF